MYNCFAISKRTDHSLLLIFVSFNSSAMYNNNKYSVSSDPVINTYFNCYVLNLLWVYGNHVFLLCLYNCYFFTGPVLSLFGASIGLWKLLAVLAAPWSISRLLIMIYLLFTSMRNLGNQDYLRRIASKSKSQANHFVSTQNGYNKDYRNA